MLARATHLRKSSERPRKRHAYRGVLPDLASYVNTFTSLLLWNSNQKATLWELSLETKTWKTQLGGQLESWFRATADRINCSGGPRCSEGQLFTWALLTTRRFCVQMPWEFQKLSKEGSLNLECPSTILQFPGLSLGNSNLVKADKCIQQQSWFVCSISRPSVFRVQSLPGTSGASSWTDIEPVLVLLLEFRDSGAEENRLQDL